MTRRRENPGQAAARLRGVAASSAAFATIVVPPASMVAALGLGGAAVALDSAALGAGGAAAGCLGAGVAYWHTTVLEGRFSRERMRNREAHRRLQLMIEDLRKRFAATPAPVAVEPVAVEPVAVEPVAVEPVVALEPVVQAVPGAVVVPDMVPDMVPDTVPDTVPDPMPVERPQNAPAISMELPVLSTSDEPVASGHLAAVVELRSSPRHLDTSPMPIGELERKVYAAIAAQDAQKVLDAPVETPVEAPAEKQSVSS